MNTISVLSDSHTFVVAQKIMGIIHENKRVQIEAIGAAAVNRVAKALSMVTGQLKAQDISLACVPEDSDVVIEDRQITAIKIVVDSYNQNELLGFEQQVLLSKVG